jgi:hypothetical protein
MKKTDVLDSLPKEARPLFYSFGMMGVFKFQYTFTASEMIAETMHVEDAEPTPEALATLIEEIREVLAQHFIIMSVDCEADFLLGADSDDPDGPAKPDLSSIESLGGSSGS